jgi:hypothetical protein
VPLRLRTQDAGLKPACRRQARPNNMRTSDRKLRHHKKGTMIFRLLPGILR